MSSQPLEAPEAHAKSGRLDPNTATPVLLRPFEEHDLEQVLALYRRVFGEEAARAFQRRWWWSQYGNLYPEETYRWVLVSQDRVVGFLATIPQSYRVRGVTLLAHTPCDYMVAPEFRFHGLRLMKAFFQTCHACVSCDDMLATIKVMRWLGAQPIGWLVRSVRPLNGHALDSSPFWRRVPLPMRHSIIWARELWVRVRSSLGRPRFLVEPVEGFDSRFDAFYSGLSQRTPASPVRDTRFLNWRYGPASPHSGCHIAIIRGSAGELKGYVIFYLSKGVDRAGYVLDLQTLPPGDAALTSHLLGYAARKLRDAGASKVYYHHLQRSLVVSESPVRRQGFLPRRGYHVLARSSNGHLADAIAHPEHWSLSFGDTEASHSII